ncbi:MAG: DUF2157 domain-containing protein [Elusimicrobia bacterium]|nr:DUF2157 domain-containing protein [Elusimicrobiota bacterium]
MASYLKRLNSDLKSCAEAGIISSEQQQKTYGFIRLKREFRLSSVNWISIISGLFTAAGILLVISHNWDRIPALFKMAGFLLLLLAAGELSIRSDLRNVKSGEALAKVDVHRRGHLRIKKLVKIHR